MWQQLNHCESKTNVDADDITLLGFSAGALEAPVVATKVPVQNIVVFGSLTMNWQEYLQSTTRARQLRLAGATAGEIEQVVALQSAGWHYLIYEGLAPDDIALQSRRTIRMGSMSNWSEGKYFSGIHYRFFQQLGKANIRRRFGSSLVDACCRCGGDQDIVTYAREEHEWIAEIANKKRPGQGTFLSIAGIDHKFAKCQANLPPPLASPIAPQPIVDAFIKWNRH